MTTTAHPTYSQVSPSMGKPSFPSISQSAPVSAPEASQLHENTAAAANAGGQKPVYGPDNPPRLRMPGESVQDYRIAMGWDQPRPTPADAGRRNVYAEILEKLLREKGLPRLSEEPLETWAARSLMEYIERADRATAADAEGQDAKLSVGVHANGVTVHVSVHLKQGDQTTLLYSQAHPDCRETAGIVSLPRSLFAADRAPATSAAALDVLAERRRQVEAEGWTPEHDDQYAPGTMARAAACYAAINTYPTPSMWPWAPEWWKPRDFRSNYVRAAALLLAEVERIDRAAAKGAAGQEGGA